MALSRWLPQSPYRPVVMPRASPYRPYRASPYRPYRYQTLRRSKSISPRKVVHKPKIPVKVKTPPAEPVHDEMVEKIKT